MASYDDAKRTANAIEKAIKEKYIGDGYNVHTCEVYPVPNCPIGNGYDNDNFEIYFELSKSENNYYSFIRGTYSKENIIKHLKLKGV